MFNSPVFGLGALARTYSSTRKLTLPQRLGINSILHAAFYDLNSLFCIQRFISSRERMQPAVSTYLEEHIDADSVFDEDTNYVLGKSYGGCEVAVNIGKSRSTITQGPWRAVLQVTAMVCGQSSCGRSVRTRRTVAVDRSERHNHIRELCGTSCQS